MDSTVAKRQHERRMSMSTRIQTSFRCRSTFSSVLVQRVLVGLLAAGADRHGVGNGRLARRALWRRRKLWVHTRENKAAISIQCAIRVYLARKNLQRQVRLRPPLRFLSPAARASATPSGCLGRSALFLPAA